MVATDTITTAPEVNAPNMYTTKAMFLPHLRILIAGTGCLSFLSNWILSVNTGAIVRDIDNLNIHAPEFLNKIWRDMYNDVGTTVNSATIYHFGFSTENKLNCYAYRSTNDFTSEKIAYGAYIKPEVNVSSEFTLPENIRDIMDEQIKQENMSHKNNKILIGGEIILYTLRQNDFLITIHDRFENYSENLESMLRQCHNKIS